MTDAVHNGERRATAEETELAPSWLDRLPLFVWAGASLVFLVAVAFGSIQARIWVSGRLTFQERGIAHVWRYFGDRLPDLPGGPLFPFLYYLSLGVLVGGTIAGLGLILLSPDEDPETPDRDGSDVPPPHD